MIYPSPDKLDQASSKYALVIVAAKRARQIKDRARTLVETQSSNPLTIAFEELAQGHIVPVQVGEPETIPDASNLGPVLSGLVSSSEDDDMLDLLHAHPADVLVEATSSDDDAEDDGDLRADLDDDDGVLLGANADDDLEPIAGEDADDDLEPAADDDAEPVPDDDTDDTVD